MVGKRGLVLAALVAVVVGCGSGGSSSDQGAGGPNDPSTDPGTSGTPGVDPPNPDQLKERPWEVVSKKGETYLADVFYADAIENEQVMPYAIDGRQIIDRLVYPTLGNPNLYVKDDASDELTMVLRMEDDAIAHLSPQIAAHGDAPGDLSFALADDQNQISFYLVARDHRGAAESESAATAGPGVYRIVPKQMLMNAEPSDMPAVLKKRHTLRFVFDQAAMAGVPNGLYDARFEVKKAGQVYAHVFEWQYNAVRVFDHASEEFTAVNVTDTQASVNSIYSTLTSDHLDDFVDAINASTDANVRSAAFITFNGDLHNGGSPGTLSENSVAATYMAEARRIIQSLKNLSLPIFLTPGNHDGYSSTGAVPSEVAKVDGLVGSSLQKVVGLQNDIAWPDFTWDQYKAYLDKVQDQQEGLHTDIVTGAFTRLPGKTFSEAWKEVPRAQRNMMLYDGFQQWQKSYGPLMESWTFGKNRYVSLNTYELRQHRRSGWGMYTVNYGGAVSKAQLEWVDREIGRARLAGEDMTLLMHHDPRGGHKGVDFGYYFPIVQYKSFEQSAINYLINDKFSPLVCKMDDAQLTVQDQDGCLHDGLQEWMAPDTELDGSFMSGVELLQRIVKAPEIRTLLIGHAHLNSMEVLQKGDTLVPGKVTLDADPQQSERLTWLEGSNPVRNFALGHAMLGAPNGVAMTKASLLPHVNAWRKQLDGMLDQATPAPMRVLSGGPADAPRELAILRLTSNADLASEKYQNASMYGWSIVHITKKTGVPRINSIHYMIHNGGDGFDTVADVDIDRTKSLTAKAPDNQVAKLFTW
jgi:hypothetical protein